MKHAVSTLWNPNAFSYNYRLPDGFVVKADVMVKRKETITINKIDYEIVTEVNKPQKKGRLLSSAIVHSVDGMIARELTYRCNYNKELIDYVTRCIFKEFSDEEIYETEDNDMVVQIWNDYIESGFLSTKILNHINGANINLVDRSVIYKLIQSLPSKPFYVLPLHDEFACRASYVNDMRKQYNYILKDIWNSNLLAHIINQFTHTQKVSYKSITPEHRAIGEKIFNSEYTIH